MLSYREFLPVLAFGLSALAGCSLDAVPDGAPDPSDDPADWTVPADITYVPRVSEPRWIIPSPTLAAVSDTSNANVEIEFFQGRLYVAWRAAPFHFASTKTRTVIASSGDEGKTWQVEKEISIGTDMREPRFLRFGGELSLMYFEAGSNPLAFSPTRIWWLRKDASGAWTEPVIWKDEPEVPWDLKVRGGRAYLTSYIGDHYKASVENGKVDLHFRVSVDGVNWRAAGSKEIVYQGGVSEAAFEFDEAGDLWAITRNEDGDASGWGSHVCFAKRADLGDWDCSASSPERYDSPEMFRHGKELYLLARRDIGGPFGSGEKAGDLIAYSTRPKRSALYRINRQSRSVEWLYDIPGVGDTAFASVRRVSAHHFLFANYTSPLDNPDISWIGAQGSDRGTQIYLADIFFEPQKP